MRLKIIIGGVLVVLLLVLAIVLLTGGDDDEDNPGTGSAREATDDDGADRDRPRLRTLDTKRSEGKNATAGAAGFTRDPGEFWLRLSAAPKQPVKGSWNVSCAGGGLETDTFKVTPPHLMQLKVPDKKAESCVAGATAQLENEGRIKVTILRDR